MGIIKLVSLVCYISQSQGSELVFNTKRIVIEFNFGFNRKVQEYIFDI